MSIKYRVEYFKEMYPLKDISSFIDFASYNEAYDFFYQKSKEGFQVRLNAIKFNEDSERWEYVSDNF